MEKQNPTELAAVQLEGNAFHPEWNYTIKPIRLDHLNPQTQELSLP